MGFIDGAGSAKWSGFRFTANAVTASVSVAPLQPQNATRIPSLGVPLQFDVDNSGATSTDVQVQVATDNAFSNLVWSTTLTGLPNGVATIQPSGLTNNTTYYWRARGATAGTTGWGPWSGILTPVGGQISTSGATPSASSAFDANWVAANAFNGAGGDSGNAWASAAAAPQWLAIQFTAAQTLGSYQIEARGAGATQAPKTWTFEGSNDGSTWTVLDTQTNAAAWTGSEKRTFSLPSPVSYSRFRINVSASSDTLVAIAELRLYVPTTQSILPLSFTVDLNAGKAFGYSVQNIGASGPLYKGDIEYVVENIGFETKLYAGVLEYILQNVGFRVTLDPDVAEYVYEGDVSTNRPSPHLWFLWRPFGFAGDEVWLYGQGFGNPQGQYSGHVFIDAGPDYTDADIEPGINEWYLQEVTTHAYDDQRTIYPGTNSTPPRVDQQVEIIRVNIPAEITPDSDATVEHFYVKTTAGPSNAVDWLMYPTIPVPATSAPSPVRSGTTIRLRRDLPEQAMIEQRYAYVELPEYIIINGRAESLPAFFVDDTDAAVELGTWSVQDALADALSVNLGATRRWLPDPAKLTARPDLGTGSSLWVPSAGDTGRSWYIDDATAPYIDPAYEVDTRLGTKTVPAMIFDGTSYAAYYSTLPDGPAFTIAMVAVLHPSKGKVALMETFVNASADLSTEHWKLELDATSIISRFEHGSTAWSLNAIGNAPRATRLEQLSGRPVIIVASVAATWQRLLVVDKNPEGFTTSFRGLNATGQRLWLGRGVQIGDLMQIATMDVLDIAQWDTALSASATMKVVNKLDGIWGVTG